MSKIILELPADTKMIDIRRALIEMGLVFHRIEPGPDTHIIAEKKWAPRLMALGAKEVEA